MNAEEKNSFSLGKYILSGVAGGILLPIAAFLLVVFVNWLSLALKLLGIIPPNFSLYNLMVRIAIELGILTGPSFGLFLYCFPIYGFSFGRLPIIIAMIVSFIGGILFAMFNNCGSVGRFLFWGFTWMLMSMGLAIALYEELIKLSSGNSGDTTLNSSK